MTQEQLDLLRGAAEQDRDNCISIAILKLLDMVEEQKEEILSLEYLLNCHEHLGEDR